MLIAASGSGGHLFPALAVAQALTQHLKGNSLRIEFVGSGRPLEAKLLDGAGYKRHQVKIQGVVGRGVGGFFSLVLEYPRALLQVWKLVSTFRPQLVIGVGGYASFLPVTVARLWLIPTWIHEAEGKPGLANTILSTYSSKVSVGFERTSIWWRKVELTGHPVRGEISTVPERKASSGAPRTILILGGSQGAQALDDGALTLCDVFRERGLRIVHQTRPENVERVRAEYAKARVNVEVISFIDDMVGAYTAADIIVSRSGAASVTEISIINRPAIFVPLPSSQGGHQVINARSLVEKGKALLVLQGDGFEARLKEAVEKLLNAEFYLSMLGRVAQRRGSAAAAEIAGGCAKLLGR